MREGITANTCLYISDCAQMPLWGPPHRDNAIFQRLPSFLIIGSLYTTRERNQTQVLQRMIAIGDEMFRPWPLSIGQPARVGTVALFLDRWTLITKRKRKKKTHRNKRASALIRVREQNKLRLKNNDMVGDFWNSITTIQSRVLQIQKKSSLDEPLHVMEGHRYCLPQTSDVSVICFIQIIDLQSYLRQYHHTESGRNRHWIQRPDSGGGDIRQSRNNQEKGKLA